MITRIVGLVIGVVLGLLAWAIIQPHGALGAHLPWLVLGAFEPERFAVGCAAAALGAVIFVAALMPKDDPPKSGGGGGGERRATPLVFDMDPTPSAHEATPVSDTAPLAMMAAAPALAAASMQSAGEPAPLDKTAAAPTPPPTPPPMAGQSFQAARTALHDLAHAEDWTGAAALARRLPSLATNDTERALAAQDVGDLARSGGHLDEAAEAYHEALGYARAVHAAAPADPAGSELLAAALTNVGDAAQDEGRLDAAVEAYDEALALRRAGVAAGRADAPALHALSISLERLADAREDRGHRMRALDLYKESFDIAGHLAAADPTRYGADLASTRQRLAELESRIAG